MWVNVALAVTLLAIVAASHVEANGRWGGARPGVIDDRPQTVRDIEERADIKWAQNTAQRWRLDDTAYCAKATVDMTVVAYAVCLVERSHTRILFMLRRGCVGGHGISEICNIPLEVTQ